MMMLSHAAYGKSAIRLVKVARHAARHDLIDLTVAIRFEGDYESSYTAGDNRDVLPTDTMKNTVYALAARASLDQPESFALALARHFLDRNPRLRRVQVEAVQHPWRRMTTAGREDGYAFVREGPETRTALVSTGRGGDPDAAHDVEIHAGIRDLVILKSSQSAFAGFLRDEFTTLPETNDRILATSLTTTWRYARQVDFGATAHTIRQILLDTFTGHESASVQHTLFAMGRAVIDRVADVTSIHLVMPNRHHLPVDLRPFGLQNRNEIFVATDEPFGRIEATIARS
jgi:urate oxidase